MRRHQDEHFVLRILICLTAEEHAEERQVAEDRHLAVAGDDLMLNQAADDERLAVFQLDRRVDAISVAAGDGGALNRRAVGGVEVADFRLDFQVDTAVAQDDGQEVQARAELLELDADLAETGRDRNGLLAAGQEAGRRPLSVTSRGSAINFRSCSSRSACKKPRKFQPLCTTPNSKLVGTPLGAPTVPDSAPRARSNGLRRSGGAAAGAEEVEVVRVGEEVEGHAAESRPRDQRHHHVQLHLLHSPHNDPVHGNETQGPNHLIQDRRIFRPRNVARQQDGGFIERRHDDASRRNRGAAGL